MVSVDYSAKAWGRTTVLMSARRASGGCLTREKRSSCRPPPPTPCRLYFRFCVFNKFSHFWQKTTPPLHTPAYRFRALRATHDPCSPPSIPPSPGTPPHTHTLHTSLGPERSSDLPVGRPSSPPLPPGRKGVPIRVLACWRVTLCSTVSNSEPLTSDLTSNQWLTAAPARRAE